MTKRRFTVCRAPRSANARTFSLAKLAGCIDAALVKRAGGAVFVAAAGLALATAPELAWAENFVVTSSDDFGDGLCLGACTLREAVAVANMRDDADTITFASGVTGTITLLAGQIPISGQFASDLTIIGPGANKLTVDAGDQSRIFKANNPGTDARTLSIEGLTLANGHSTGQGGALYVNGSDLSLDDVIIRNSHSDNKGGGFIVLRGDATLSNSAVSGNSAAFGGGFYVSEGKADLSNSSVSGNSVSASANSAGGGFFVNIGDVYLTNSTVSGNTAIGSSARGGGFNVVGGDASLSNSTVSGNTASDRGGGFFVLFGQALLNHSTVSGNTASGQGGGFFVDGVSGNGGSAIIANSIVANNTAGSAAEFFVDFTVTAKYSLLESSHDPAPSGSSTGNIFGQDPGLGPLQNNGGPTETLAIIAATSPAYNGGENPAVNVPAYDQRGAPFARVAGGRVDIGAYEYVYVADQQSGSTLTVNTVADPGAQIGCSASECSLREAVARAGNLAGANTIQFDPALSSSKITLSSGAIGIRGNDDLSISGPGADQLSVYGSGLARLFHTTASATLTIEDLNLANGQSTAEGGAIYASGTDLNLNRVMIQGSHADGNGGGFYAKSGTVTLAGSTVHGNESYEDGGGFFVNSAATTVTHSTIAGNYAAYIGGGFYVNAGSILLAHSTVTGNQAFDDGGGFFVNAASATLANSIVANNEALASAGKDEFGRSLTGSSLSANYSLVEGSSSGIDSGSHNIIGQDPLLGPLQDNGGPTLTSAISSSASPAYNAGDHTPTNLPAYDQRGAPFARVSGAFIDIGAYEYIIGQQTGTTLTVNTAADPGLIAGCTPGECALREAVIRASNLPGANAIQFDPALASSTITLSGSGIGITGGDALSISGPAVGEITLDGNNQSRIVHATSSGQLTLEHLTLANGNNAYLPEFSDGGALYAYATNLVLHDVTIRDSHASFNGGGFAVEGGGSTTVSNSTLSGNSAFVGGGGVYANGNITVMDSTIADNNGGYFGGGFFMYTGNATFTNCTISGNDASSGGGIILSYGGVSVTNSTVSFNTASESGGGINTFKGNVTLTNSIVAKNTAGIVADELVIGNDGSVTANYSLIFGSTISPPISGGGNLIGSSYDPNLGPLQNNGGLTFTHALLPGSAAIDSGDPAFVPPPQHDQRGAPFMRVSNGRLDMGAVEYQVMPDLIFADGFD